MRIRSRQKRVARRASRPTAAHTARRPLLKPASSPALEQQLNDLHIGMAHVSPDFRVLWVNPAFARLARRPAAELVGAALFDLFPDNLLITIFHEVLDTGQAQSVYGHPLPPLFGEPDLTYWDLSVQPYGLPQGGLLLAVNDSSTREGALQAFHQAQTLFYHLFESAPDANLLVKQSGEIIAANTQVEVLFGYPRSELIGHGVEMLVPSEARQRHVGERAEFWQNMQKRPMGAGLELYGLRKNGMQFPVDITLSPLESEQGSLVLCVIHDLSMRNANQQALEAQTALVQLLQEVAAAANQSVSPSVAFQVAVDRIRAFLGWSAGHVYLVENATSQLPRHIWSTGLPESMQAVRAASEITSFQPGEGLIGQTLLTALPIWVTNPTQRPNLRRRAELQAAGIQTILDIPVMAENDVVGVMEFFSDQVEEPNPRLLEALPNVGIQLGRVIERQRAEEALNQRAAQLRAVVSNLPVILMTINTGGQITFFDGRGLQSIGRRPGELVGQSIFEILPASSILLPQLKRALSGEEAQAEVNINKNDFQVFFSPYHDGDERLEGVLALVLDITTRKQMENDLEEIKHHLMESVEAERMRLAVQLHDGPLQDLYGVFYQMQEVKSQLPSDKQSLSDSALDTIQKVNSTLRFICGELRPTTLAHLGLKMAIRSHSERLQEQYPQLTIHLELEDDAQQLVANQRISLYRIYQNLINNVARHANARHAWVRLILLPDQVILEVQDNGQGFTMPTSWVELVRKGSFGLVGAQERAAALGGDLEVRTQPGSGILARVTIPRMPPAVQ